MLNESVGIPSRPFSAGLHPWYADQLSPEDLSKKLNQYLESPDLFAIGETGLDKVCKIPMDLQMEILKVHLKKAQENNLPVIIHCVKAWEELIEITSKYQTTNILHGYNGGIQLTERLIKQGFCFSIGKAISMASSKIQSAIHLIPLNAIFCETDTSEDCIADIYIKVSGKMSMSTEDLRRVIFENYNRLKGRLQQG